MNSKLQCLKNSGKIKRYVFYVIVIAVSVFLDQITKYVTAKSGKSYKIISDLLQIIPVKNNGMAFGMLGGWKYAQAFFITFTIITLALVGVYVVKTNNNDKTLHWAISLLIGGTIGNFIDRVIWREVRDFLALDLRIAILQFNCNVADIVITVGAVLLFVYFLFLDKDALLKNKKALKQETEPENREIQKEKLDENAELENREIQKEKLGENAEPENREIQKEKLDENDEPENVDTTEKVSDDMVEKSFSKKTDAQKQATAEEDYKDKSLEHILHADSELVSGKEISGELTGQKIAGKKNYPLQEIKIEQDKDDENEN